MWLFILIAAIAFAPPDIPPTQPALPASPEYLRPALQLLRAGKNEEARRVLSGLLKDRPVDAELYYQLSRSYMADFYEEKDRARARTALNLAMEALSNALRRNPDNIPALKTKGMIHARAELLFYDPNLAYRMAARVAQLQPAANEYLLTMTDWLSGEVRFTVESGHRVPHDPLVALDRSIEILDRVLDSAVPYSNEEAMGLLQMGRSLQRRGKFPESSEYFKRAITRPSLAPIKSEILRDIGVSAFRSGDYGEASAQFYAALQAQPNAVDQWLLKVAMDRMKGGGTKLPDWMVFPSREIPVDPKAAAMLQFEDMAPAMGLDRFDGNGTCAFGDLDGDGKPDLLLTGSGTFMAVYRNEGKKFTDVTAQAGLEKVPSGYSLNLVDIDNDGDLDLYIAMNGWNGPYPNMLYQNDGKGHFTDISKESGAADPGDGFVTVWGDLDKDGCLDLVVANGVLKDGSTPQIYRNDCKGQFRNVTREAGMVEPPTFGVIGAALGDYDKDGDLDIFFNGNDAAPNRLYRNDGNWKFTDVTRAAGVGSQPRHNGFVAFFTDYDNDTWPDLLTVSLAPWEATIDAMRKTYTVPNAKAVHPEAVRLYKNNKDGTFRDVTFEAKLYYPMGVMGAGVADLDNDGCIDFYFGTGDPQLSRLEPNRFYRNNCDGTFTDMTAASGFGRPGDKGHGVCFIDIDEDGDLDVYAQLGGHYPGDWARNAFYRNFKGNQNHWLQIDLKGVKSNRYAVGVQITAKAGDLTVFREVKGSEGFGSTNPYRQHIGLGQHEKVDTLEVLWPSGTRRTYRNIPANQRIELTENNEAVRKLE